MENLIFFNNKGGVGKTASVTTIAHILATEFQKKVLLIDLDPQMNTTCLYSEVDFLQLFAKVYYITVKMYIRREVNLWKIF